ncbi:MAG: thiamine-phosphate kinase [Luminiphilus sp.]|nr:thiamine-phosphate kinase [Luminiphilus sp.]
MAGREFDLIYRHLGLFGAGSQVRLGVGDDGAVLALPPNSELVVSSDSLVEGTHFPELTLPEYVATRAIAAAASDLAAMAADPLAMTLALTLPDPDELWLHSFSQGLERCVQALALPLVGGDLTRGPLSVTVTVMGSVPTGGALRRSGAKPGDRLCVTNTLGDAAAGLALIMGQLPSEPEIALEDEEFLEARFYQPTARLEWVPWLREHARSAIDISDGLLVDTEHMADASGCACSIDSSSLPMSSALSGFDQTLKLDWALAGGDDYELAVAVPPGVPLPSGLIQVGEFHEGSGVQCDYRPVARKGFDHFGA